jgi:hypothetical protein
LLLVLGAIDRQPLRLLIILLRLLLMRPLLRLLLLMLLLMGVCPSRRRTWQRKLLKNTAWPS